MFAFLRHLFLPHESNNHRSFLLHHKSLFVLILLVVISTSLLFSIRNVAPNVLGIATDISVDGLLSFTNQKRQEQGTSALLLNAELSQAAAAKASDMFSKDYWAHNAPDGTTPWVYFQNVGYRYVYAGENLAKDFNDSTGVVDAWMASSSHRENMLSGKYDEVGFAVVNGKLNGSETTLVVEMLGKRQGSQVAVVPASQAQPIATPTQQAAKLVVTTPVPTLAPTSVPSPTIAPVAIVKREPLDQTIVAGVTNRPFIDSSIFTKRLALSVLVLLVIAFILDMLYIERRKLVRLVGHNADHIIFLVGAMALIAIFGRGAIL